MPWPFTCVIDSRSNRSQNQSPRSGWTTVCRGRSGRGRRRGENINPGYIEQVVTIWDPFTGDVIYPPPGTHGDCQPPIGRRCRYNPDWDWDDHDPIYPPRRSRNQVLYFGPRRGANIKVRGPRAYRGGGYYDPALRANIQEIRPGGYGGGRGRYYDPMRRAIIEEISPRDHH